MRTVWADCPEFVTQCPIRPRKSYTYRFTIQGQEGTLWWHAHSLWLRATVYGALIIHPKEGSSYPFPKPKRETALVLGTDHLSLSEWWDANPIDVVRTTTRTAAAPNVSIHTPSMVNLVTFTNVLIKVCFSLISLLKLRNRLSWLLVSQHGNKELKITWRSKQI
ncbi:hypothetical protein CsSME_00007463 [Camellia sinensis var. sinensis]